MNTKEREREHYCFSPIYLGIKLCTYISKDSGVFVDYNPLPSFIYNVAPIVPKLTTEPHPGGFSVFRDISFLQQFLTFSYWNGAGLYGPCPPPPTMSSAYLLYVENFSQRIGLIKEVGNVETTENSQRRPNNNNIVIKHSQEKKA